MDEGQQKPRGRVWRFAGIELDERSLELRRDGELVALERKSKAVLLHLLLHAGEVVTKDELIDAVWPGRVLSDSTITKTLSRLRSALNDDGQQLIRTEHGFGYRLIAEVQVEQRGDPAPSVLSLGAGDHPPLRPNWTLIERLGSGGHGEAWRVRHDKTGESRVFKFALDAGALSALRREVTLSRFLRQSLGPRPEFVEIIDWNLEQAPFYIETPHVAGGNLSQWLEACGGAAQLPLDTRLEIVARIADGLAAAHAVGVLHKDLKPGNLLVDGPADAGGAAPTIRLADFGSGVVDRGRLDQLGITRLGFTQTLAEGGSSSATPLYMAPELLRGQPATVKADIYALGLILYQMVVADPGRPLAPGWEADVEDELLRADIAAAVDGHPDRRLGDAAELAARLRGLGERRQRQQAERESAARVARAQALRRELQRMRVAVVALVGLAIVAGVASVQAWRSRDQALDAQATAMQARDDALQQRRAAEQAARTTAAVSEFMTEELLGGLQLRDAPQAIDFGAILEQASARVDERLAGFPEAAAEVHYVLGRRFIRRFDRQQFHLQRAAELYAQTQGELGQDTLLVRMHLADAYEHVGEPAVAVAHWQAAHAGLLRKFGPDSLLTLEARAQLAFSRFWTGDFGATIVELDAVRTAMPAARALSEEEIALRTRTGRGQRAGDVRDSQLALVDLMLGNALRLLQSDLARAEALGASALARFEGLEQKDTFRVVLAHQTQAELLSLRGRPVQAEALLERAEGIVEARFGTAGEFRDFAREWRALVDLWQRRYDPALAVLQGRLDRCQGFANCSARFTPNTRDFLARGYLEAGRLDEARREYRKTLETRIALLDAANPWTLSARVGLAQTYRRQAEPDAARAVLEPVDAAMLAAFPADSLNRADYWWVRGLLAADAGDGPGAAEFLRRALSLYQAGLGADHWRTQALAQDLAAHTSTAEGVSAD